MGLTPDQVKIIKATVPVVKEHGNTITTVFYKNLLTENPTLNNIFNTANQVNGHQPAALATALYAYASNIDDLGVLSPFVERVCHKHASLYITRDQYDIVGTYLLAAMKQILGDALTPEIHDAWAAAYVQLANLMADREEQMYQEHDDWNNWRKFKISKKVPESSEITSFYLEPMDGKKLPSFRPGQYISVQTDVPALKYLQSRQYSLSDKPNADYYRISVKKERGLNPAEPSHAAHPGYISNILHDVKKEGDIIEVSHPQGEFFLSYSQEKTTSPIVLLSAGVGLTPLISMLNYLTSLEARALLQDRKIHFVHGTRSTSDQAFRKHLQSLQAQYPNNIAFTFFNKSPAQEDEEGKDYHHRSRVDLEKLDLKKDLYVDDRGTEYYICGPTSCMTDMRNKLESYGVDPDRIRLELFGTGGVQ